MVKNASKRRTLEEVKDSLQKGAFPFRRATTKTLHCPCISTQTGYFANG